VIGIAKSRKEKSPKTNIWFGAFLDSSKKKQWYFNRPGFLLLVPKNFDLF